MDVPEVSVVMSVYNGETYLREAVDSILQQTFRNLEFIVVDDGSTDGTRRVLESYADNRIVLINQENAGLARSLNRGIRLAKGKYIARMDADDISMPERLMEQVSFLERNPNVAVVGAYAFWIDENGKPQRTLKFPTAPDKLRRALLWRIPFCHGSVMCRKDCLETAGLYREDVGPVEDYNLWFRIAETHDLANIPEYFYKLRVHSQSLTSSTRRREHIRRSILQRCLALEKRETGRDRFHVFEATSTIKLPESSAIGGITFRIILQAMVAHPFSADTWLTTWSVVRDAAVYLLLPKSVADAAILLKRKASRHLNRVP